MRWLRLVRGFGRQRVHESGVAGEDALVQRDQLRPRLDAQLVDQQLPNVPKGGQGVGPSPRLVLRLHQQRVESFLQGVLVDEALELGDEPVAVPECEADLYPLFLERQACFGEPVALTGSERAGDRGQWLALPQRQSRVEKLIGAVEVACLTGAFGPVCQLLGAQEVHIAVVERQPVSVAERNQCAGILAVLLKDFP